MCLCLWQVSMAGDSRSFIGHLLVTFGGAPSSNVADSLDGACLGRFMSLLLLCNFLAPILPLTMHKNRNFPMIPSTFNGN